MVAGSSDAMAPPSGYAMGITHGTPKVPENDSIIIDKSATLTSPSLGCLQPPDGWPTTPCGLAGCYFKMAGRLLHVA
jgi:hypothetical protein